MGGVVEVIVWDNRSSACADRNFYWPPRNLGPVVIHQDLHPDRRDVAYMGNFTECTEDVITDTDGHGARLLAVQARRELDARNGRLGRSLAGRGPLEWDPNQSTDVHGDILMGTDFQALGHLEFSSRLDVARREFDTRSDRHKLRRARTASSWCSDAAREQVSPRLLV
ncbi:hypothetical protein T492DRAFT_899251 [Pavlovales sp. CCMP2436]|nr:hypothetical protein T492DRAFT_899251 [Pavlovales sp. CCMP2436]